MSLFRNQKIWIGIYICIFFTMIAGIATKVFSESVTRNEAVKKSSSIGLHSCPPKTVFVKMGDHIFEVPRDARLFLQNNEKMVSYNSCENSLTNPVEVNHMSFFDNEVPLPDHKGSASIQFELYSLPHPHQDQLDYIEMILKEEKITIKNLPREGDFYKYKGEYIAADNQLKTPDGRPVVFSCGWGGPLNCITIFTWHKSFLVQIEGATNSNMPMDGWKELYPELLQRLADHEITKEKN